MKNKPLHHFKSILLENAQNLLKIPFLNFLLKVENENRNIVQIVFWWELRRLLYNLVVLACGLLSLGIMGLLVNTPPGEDLVEPFAVIGFGLLCNVFYGLGWLTEIFRKKSVAYGPVMFCVGLIFTLFFVFLPLNIHFILWILRGFTTMY